MSLWPLAYGTASDTFQSVIQAHPMVRIKSVSSIRLGGTSVG